LLLQLLLSSSISSVDQATGTTAGPVDVLLFRGTHKFPLRASDPEVFVGDIFNGLSDAESIPGTFVHEAELSNEFQLIRPSHIVDLRDGVDRRRTEVPLQMTPLAISRDTSTKDASIKSSADVYNITHITPLVIDNDDVVTVYFQSSNPKSNDWIGKD